MLTVIAGSLLGLPFKPEDGGVTSQKIVFFGSPQ
jgi:hypothetical protein